MATNIIRLQTVVPRCGDGRRHLLFITAPEEAGLLVLGPWGKSALREYPGLTSIAVEKHACPSDFEPTNNTNQAKWPTWKVILEGDIKPAKIGYRLVEWLSVAVRI